MKKTLFYLMVLAGFLLSCQTKDKPSDDPVVEVFTVPANKAYAEPFTPGDPGVHIPVGYVEDTGVVSHWVNKDKTVAWYIYLTEGKYDFFIESEVNEGTNKEFKLHIEECYDLGFNPINKEIAFEGLGRVDTTFCSTVTVVKTGYYRYALEPITDPAGEVVINSLLFNSLTEGGLAQQTDYQSSPSVHLSYSTTGETTGAYDWIYGEILVPEGNDPLYTYYMSLGFYRGYLGIQTNSETERRVLFSVWDSKDAEQDDTMTSDDFVSLVDKGDRTTVNSFGGEGTGGQSYVKDAAWITGEPVKFLMNVRPMTNNSVVLSAWYKTDADWVYVASWRAPKEQRYFDGYHSFLENYGYSNGNLRREAYYYNAWGNERATGNWVHFNKARFSHTDGAEGQRVDYEQGVSPDFPDKFYMASGGYTPTRLTAEEMDLETESLDLDLTPFKGRVEEALKNEVNYKDHLNTK